MFDSNAIIAGAVRIDIISGEGEQGHRDTYTGMRTALAIKRSLTRERCGGDRWARAVAITEAGAAYDIETGNFA